MTPETEGRAAAQSARRFVSKMVTMFSSHRVGFLIAGMALGGTALACLVVGLADRFCYDRFGPFCTALESSPPWFIVSGIAAAPALLLTWFWRTVHKEQDLENARSAHAQAERGQITSRFVAAVEMLHKEGMSGVGGVYALEQVARDSPEDHWTIVEALASVLRESTGDRHRHAIVQAAVTVIGRRNVKRDPEWGQIRLRRSRLSGADFSDLNFAGADFIDASVANCRFQGTNLAGANLFVRKVASPAEAPVYDDETNFGEGPEGELNRRMFRQRGALHIDEVAKRKPPPNQPTPGGIEDRGGAAESGVLDGEEREDGR